MGTESENPDSLAFNSPDLPIPEQGQANPVSAENLQMPSTDSPIHGANAIPTMRGLGTARLQRLADMGISTLEQLQDASPLAIATALRVSEGQSLAQLFRRVSIWHLKWLDKPPPHPLYLKRLPKRAI